MRFTTDKKPVPTCHLELVQDGDSVSVKGTVNDHSNIIVTFNADGTITRHFLNELFAEKAGVEVESPSFKIKLRN